jgi:hypothetical protein
MKIRHCVVEDPIRDDLVRLGYGVWVVNWNPSHGWSFPVIKAGGRS